MLGLQSPEVQCAKYCMQTVNKSNEQNTACKLSTNQLNKILHASCQQINWTKYCMQAVNKSTEQNTACKLSTNQMNKILHASCQQIKWAKYCMQAVNHHLSVSARSKMYSENKLAGKYNFQFYFPGAIINWYKIKATRTGVNRKSKMGLLLQWDYKV